MWLIAPSRIQGLGVIARAPITAGTILGVSHWHDGRGWQTTTLGRYHNHATEPTARNVLAGSRRYLISTRDLWPGDEITVDYRLQPDLEQPKRSWM